MLNLSQYLKEKFACAYFFACPGIAYGIFTSRLPALKNIISANDAQIGVLLLVLGGASFTGLLGGGYLIARFGAKRITGMASLCLSIFFIAASYAATYCYLLFFAMFAGLFMGLCDVAMNAQAIIIEKYYHKKTISFFHAAYSLGAVSGSFAGSFFAAASLSPFINFFVVQGCYLFLWYFALAGLKGEDNKGGAKSGKKINARLPIFVYIMGFLCMCCYVAEGSVGEWGSILLHSVKGATQEMAALVYAAFSCAMTLGRLMGDVLRSRLNDFWIILIGSIISGIAMLAVLVASSPLHCLLAYALMGMGLAPIVPIFYSRAGNAPGVSPGQASSAVSLFAYSGLLVFPPFIGTLAEKFGLDKSLWLIIFVIFCIGCGSFALRGPNLRHGD